MPLLVISGQVKSKDMMGYEDNVRQSGVQEVKIVEMIKKILSMQLLYIDPLKIRYHLEKAFI